MKIKITNKPKKIKVIYHEYKTYYTEYTCPSCHITFKNGGPRKNVTRFKCEECGQELIVENNNG